MEARRTIRLSFDAASHETVEVTDVAPGQVRLHDTPLLAEAPLAPGDVIQVEEGPDGVCRFERLIGRGGLRTHSWSISRELAESSELKGFKLAVLDAGGQVEQIMGGFLLVHLPPDSALDAERELDAVIARVESRRAAP